MTGHDKTKFGQPWALLSVQLSSESSSELSSATARWPHGDAGIAGQLPPKRRDMTSKTRGIRR